MDGRLDTALDLSFLRRRALRRSLTTGWVAGTGTSGSATDLRRSQPAAAVAEEDEAGETNKASQDGRAHVPMGMRVNGFWAFGLRSLRAQAHSPRMYIPSPFLFSVSLDY